VPLEGDIRSEKHHSPARLVVWAGPDESSTQPLSHKLYTDGLVPETDVPTNSAGQARPDGGWRRSCMLFER